jgi:hypothetical protein
MIFFTARCEGRSRKPIDSAITAYRDLEKGKERGFATGETVQALHVPAEGHSPSTGGLTGDTFHEG